MTDINAVDCDQCLHPYWEDLVDKNIPGNDDIMTFKSKGEMTEIYELQAWYVVMNIEPYSRLT